MHHHSEGQEKMGIVHSISRHGEESDQSPLGEYSSEKLPIENSIFHSLIYKTVKGLLQKLRFVFSLLRPRKPSADPILPIQNPAPVITIISNDSSSANSAAFAPLADHLNTNDQESLCETEKVIVESSQQWPAPPETRSGSATGKEIIADHVKGKSTDIEMMSSSSQGKGEADQRKEDQEVSIIKKTVAVVVHKERWIKHYSSRHRILVVGDGDFSFSASLAVAFGGASNMIATSLDSIDFLKKNYGRAASNIEKLRNRGCKVMHGIDATEIANHALLGHLKFDRIIYNFPFAGFFKELSQQSQLRRHRRLVSLFLKNAKEMISKDGEIHISHKTNGFHAEWKLESIASSHGLRLIEALDFNTLDYPGYNTKYGFGGDGNFNCYPSNTYKFGLKIIY